MNRLFIEPELLVNKKLRQNASYIRKEFSLNKPIAKAIITLSACGLYKTLVNGQEISNQVLLPGFTFYKERLQYQTFDVTNLLSPGNNSIAAVIGDGWYRGRVGLLDRTSFYGEKIKFMCVLDVTFTDGTTQRVVTDTNWKATQDGPIRKNDLKSGEEYDATLEMPGWDRPGFDDSKWHGVLQSCYKGKLVPSEGEHVLEQETFSPKVLKTPNGETVLDFGQNISGYVSFCVHGRNGHKVGLIHGETLDEKGNFTLKNLQLEGKKKINKPLQINKYTLKDGAQTYKPTFTMSGFQYVKLVNWPETIKSENFSAIAVYSDVKPNGNFECSNPLINQLVNNIRWSMKSNFVDIPTDCPTRERAGWTGDPMIFSESACYLGDTKLFFEKWIKDVALQQRKDGRVSSIVPDVGLLRFITDGSVGWGDAICIIPWTLYQFYNDKQILEEVYDNIVRWVECNRKRARRMHLSNLFKSGAHRRYILDTGYHWGEWLEPGSVMLKDGLNNIFLPDAEVATAYFANAARLLGDVAELLGKQGEAAKYRGLFTAVRDAYRIEFIKDGRVSSSRMCRYVRPLALDLVTESEKKTIVRDLNEMVIKNEYRIGTGFLTTPFVLQVLADQGYVDTAYKMLENTRRPGWLYAVTKGATTIWENWNGKDENNVPVDSFNHFAPGSVLAWLFNSVVGIRPAEPGFEKIMIRPIPGGSLNFAKATYKSVAGEISSEWKIEGDLFSLSVNVPRSAEIRMPNGEVYQVMPGKHKMTCKIVGY